MYSSAMWAGTGTGTDLERAQERKIDFFASRVLPGPGPRRVLDVGCGWGWCLRRLAEAHRVTGATGLTLSRAQLDYLTEYPVPGADIRLENWNDHDPGEPYDAIFSFGAFEHFARDGTTGPQRIATYRRFFRSCMEWLAPGGRLALETIAHDGAPDTDAPLGRGPLGDFVLNLSEGVTADKAEAKRLLREILAVIRGEVYPEATKYKARCKDCCYRNVCLR
jgi:cyclopropane-fatty-acyl-phospholipid synthase